MYIIQYFSSQLYVSSFSDIFVSASLLDNEEVRDDGWEVDEVNTADPTKVTESDGYLSERVTIRSCN